MQIFALVGFCQIVSSFGYTFRSSVNAAVDGDFVGLTLPPVVLQMCDSLAFVNIDVQRVLSEIAPCSSSLPFTQRLFLAMMTLPALGVATALALAASVACARPTLPKHRAAAKDRALRWYLSTAAASSVHARSTAGALACRYCGSLCDSGRSQSCVPRR